MVGEEAALAAVRHPHRLPVGPETARGAVRVGEFELVRLDALAGLEVVGEDTVGGAVAVLADPQRFAVAPQARRVAVGRVEVFDGGRCLGHDPQYPVASTAVRGGHVERSVGAHHRSPKPTVVPVQLRYGELTHERPVFGEFEHAQGPGLQRGHCQPPLPRTPRASLQEGGAACGEGWVTGRPPGCDGVGELRQVGHRDGLVVAGHGMPAVVAARHEQVDFVVY